jgi:hypothetical protein
MVYLSVELRASTITEWALAVRNDTHWTAAILFQGLSSSEWRTYTWSFEVPITGRITLLTGFKAIVGDSIANVVWLNGSVQLKNFHLYKSADLVTIDAPLRCEKDAFFSTSIESHRAYVTSITAGQYFSTSDERIKTDVQDASLEACQRIFDAVVPKVYERTDMPGQRVGFIAQHIQSSAPPEFANLWGTRPGADGQELLTIDYSRIASCVLWGVVKLQQAKIADLTSRLEALEEAQ